jgi:hypothetical protein
VGFLEDRFREMFFREIPPEAKAALDKTRVNLVKWSDRIEVIIDSQGDPDVEKVKSVFLECLHPALSQIITLFGCQVEAEEMPS